MPRGISAQAGATLNFPGGKAEKKYRGFPYAEEARIESAGDMLGEGFMTTAGNIKSFLRDPS